MQKGGVISDTLEAIKDLATDTGKAVVREPLEILQKALGEDEPGEASDPLEQGSTTSPQSAKVNPTGISDQQLVAKKMDDRDTVQKLLALHRTRMKEEESFYEQTDAEKEQKTQAEEQKKQQKHQENIVQLQRQEAKDAVLQSPGTSKGPGVPGAVKQAQKLTGTREVGKAMGD